MSRKILIKSLRPPTDDRIGRLEKTRVASDSWRYAVGGLVHDNRLLSCHSKNETHQEAGITPRRTNTRHTAVNIGPVCLCYISEYLVSSSKGVSYTVFRHIVEVDIE